MYFVVEYKGVRKTVKAHCQATVMTVFELAFRPGYIDVPRNVKDMLVVGAASTQKAAERLQTGFAPGKAAQIRSRAEDSGYTRAEAKVMVESGLF